MSLRLLLQPLRSIEDSCRFSLVQGAVGFMATYSFVHTIFSSLKVD